jgi:hypothetical protein
MTLPDERYRAVKFARDFLYDLMDAKKTPGVPKAVRERARSVLRHYPDDYHMNVVSNSSPDVFQSEMEPVFRLIKKFEEGKASSEPEDKF